jgi:hypothetical protein
MAVTVTVDLTANHVIGAKDHFGTTDNAEALALFRAWVGNHANQWYQDSLKADLDAIVAALYSDPSKIAAIMAALAL